jgi:uncharacterized pyridoxal phosphate-containing UPF0001 family protein
MGLYDSGKHFLAKTKSRKWPINGTNAKDIHWHMIGHVQSNKSEIHGSICTIGA